MKHFLTFFLTLFVCLLLITIDLFIETKAQNMVSVAVDPKHANKVLIEMEGELNIQAWNEDYLLFQINMEPYPELEEVARLLVSRGNTLFHQEFTIQNFLVLKLPDFCQWMPSDDCDSYQLLSIKVKVPKYLDLELRCTNDMTIFSDRLDSRGRGNSHDPVPANQQR